MSGDFPREPVPEEAATRAAGSIAMMVSNAAMGVPVMILGASIGKDYGSFTTWLVIAIGCAITASLAASAAYAGVKSRRSTALLAKQAFGSSGAHLLNLAVAVALLGWFSVEMGFVGDMVSEGVKNVFDVAIGRGPGIVTASFLICGICVFGIGLVSRAPMLFLPFLGVLLLVVLSMTLRAPNGPLPQAVPFKSIGPGVSAIVGAYVIGCLIMPDYTRFIRTSRAAVGATVFALGPVYGVVLGTYALAGLATHHSQPTSIFLGLGLPAVIGLILPIGLMQNGIMCLYSSVLATSTLVRAGSFSLLAIVSMIAGLGLALAGADSFFVNFLVILGIIFPPAVALLIYAGLFAAPVKQPRSQEWKLAEIAVWSGGIACGVASEWGGLGATGFSAFDGFLGAGVGIAGLHLARNASVRSAAAPITELLDDER